MPPPKSILTSPARVLSFVLAYEASELEAVAEGLQSLATASLDNYRRHLEKCALDKRLQEAPHAPRNIAAIMGREPTPSERVRWQQELRRMESAGLIVLGTRTITVTDAGRAHLASVANPSSGLAPATSRLASPVTHADTCTPDDTATPLGTPHAANGEA